MVSLTGCSFLLGEYSISWNVAWVNEAKQSLVGCETLESLRLEMAATDSWAKKTTTNEHKNSYKWVRFTETELKFGVVVAESDPNRP